MCSSDLTGKRRVDYFVLRRALEEVLEESFIEFATWTPVQVAIAINQRRMLLEEVDACSRKR